MNYTISERKKNAVAADLILMTSSLLPGSWVKVAVIIAAVFILSTIWLLQLNTSVRLVAILPSHLIHLPLNRSEVERMRGSLLGCADSKSSAGGGEEEMTPEEKCVYEYNLTLSFESTMGR